MDVRFDDDTLRRLEVDGDFNGGFGREVVRGFRKAIQAIRAAPDTRDLYAMKSLHFEKLKGARSGQHSIRLNRQWRLIVELERSANGRLVIVVSIEDYH